MSKVRYQVLDTYYRIFREFYVIRYNLVNNTWIICAYHLFLFHFVHLFFSLINWLTKVNKTLLTKNKYKMKKILLI